MIDNQPDMKISLLSVPVEGAGTKLDRLRSEGSLGIVPKVAIVSLIKWMEKHGYGPETYDYLDVDMIYPDDEQLKDYFASTRPTVVGLSAVVSTSYQQIKRISKIIRDLLPDTWIVMGGNLAASSEAVLKNTHVDLTVCGDGEIAWVQFLDYVKKFNREMNYLELKKIKGLCFYDENGEVFFNGHGVAIASHEMPYPDYDLLKLGLRDEPSAIDNYFRKAIDSGWFNFDERAYEPHRKPNIAGIFLSKGCVARCTFCQRSTKGYRIQELESLENHLTELKEKYDVGFIQVLDENFGSNKKHAYEVARIFHKHDMLWFATGIRCKSVNYDDIKFFKEHGCSALKFGVESGSQKILDIMEKFFNIEDVYKAVKACLDLSVYSPLAVMVGMPGETQKTARETGQFIGNVAAQFGVHPKVMGYEIFYALPLPGTPLYEYGEHVGVIDPSPEGAGAYLERVTNAGTFKRYYVNLNGAKNSEVLFWDWLVKLEASRTYYKKVKTDIVKNNTFKDKLEEANRLESQNNPRFQLKYTALKFTHITKLFDDFIEGNRFIDALPRWFIYPLLKYAAYFEFLVQKLFATNNQNNLFCMGKDKIKRITDKHIHSQKRIREKSLRGIVKKIYNPGEEIPFEEKGKLLLRRGL